MKILYLSFNLSAAGGVRLYNKSFIEAIRLEKNNDLRLVELVRSTLFHKLLFITRVIFQSVFFSPELIIASHINFSPLCLFLKKILRIKYAIIAYGIDVWGLQSKSKLASLQSADVIISISRYTSVRLSKEVVGVENKIVIIPPCIDDLERFTIREKPGVLLEELQLSDKKIILTVARLSADEGYKGYDRVIAALPYILNNVPNAHYVIVGDGSDRKRIESLVREKHLESHITFTGRISDELLPYYFNLADVFAMPSTGEGFGIVFIEAAASGVPVVAGNVDGSVDATLNGELGILVNPESVEEIADAVSALLEGGVPRALRDKELLREKTIAAFGIQSFKRKISLFLSAFS